jgi:hypothetical protein
VAEHRTRADLQLHSRYTIRPVLEDPNET